MRFSNLVDMIRGGEGDSAVYRMRENGRFSGSLREDGYADVTLRNKQYRQYRSDLLEAARLIERVYRGDKWAGVMFREALTTSDFPALFGDVLDRQVLANYKETKSTWPMYCKRGTIQDFRLAKRFRVDRGAGILDGPIISSGTAAQQAGGSGSAGLEQISEYPERRRTDSKYQLFLEKFGARMPFAWETIINDDLDALKDTPALFGRAARRTEEHKVTSLYAASTGPNATFYSTTNANLVSAANLSSDPRFAFITTNNPPLSITALMWALQVMMLQTDLDGEPIDISAVTLVVPPSLKITAMNMLNAVQVWMNDAGGTQGLYGSAGTQSAQSLQRLLADNWAKNIVKLAVNYYLPLIDTTHGSTGWYLFADPNEGRPALEMAFLRGHEQPELFMKLPNQVAIGEGRMGPGAGQMIGTANTNPLEGDFDTDAIHYKVRHVMGGTTLDPIMTVASNGSGS